MAKAPNTAPSKKTKRKRKQPPKSARTKVTDTVGTLRQWAKGEETLDDRGYRQSCHVAVPDMDTLKGVKMFSHGRPATLNGRKWGPERAKTVLAVLAAGGSLLAASTAAGISRGHLDRIRNKYPKFGKKVLEAIEAGTDALEDEAVRRASAGVDEPVFYQGEQCGTVRKYSDSLLIGLLKARRPHKFRENHSHEMFGPEGGPIEVRSIVRTIVDPNDNE